MTETIQQLKEDIALLQMKLQKLEEMEKHKSPVEEAYKRVYGNYPDTGICNGMSYVWWDVFCKGYNASKEDYKVGEYQPKEKEQKWGDIVRESVKWCEEHPDESVEDYLTPQTPEQVDAGLRNAMRKAKKDGVFDEPTKPMNEVLDRLENKYKDAEENAASYMTDEVVNRMLKKWEENPPDFLKFELGKTLEGLISDWMDDCVPAYSTWDYELGIAILIRRIEKWLPKSQSAVGSQNVDTELLVDGFNHCLTKIKSKLRNKK